MGAQELGDEKRQKAPARKKENLWIAVPNITAYNSNNRFGEKTLQRHPSCIIIQQHYTVSSPAVDGTDTTVWTSVFSLEDSTSDIVPPTLEPP